MYKYLVFSLLLLLASGLTFSNCPLCNAHMIATESPIFELSLDYGALDQHPVSDSSATILWNGNEHGVLKPTDRSVQHFKTEIRVIEGENTLSIVGAKGSTGIVIDNIVLSRKGNKDNIIQNGDFEAPGSIALSLKSTFVGWMGFPKSVNGKSANKNFKPSTAALVLPGIKTSLKQTLSFDRQSRFQTDKYTLTFDYAAQKGAPIDSTRGTVTWNQQIFQINPKDFEIHSVKVLLKPQENKLNLLTFKGEGEADGFGLTISNIKLTSLGSSLNMILNGDFSMPVIAKNSKKVQYLPGWEISAPTATIGKSGFFNTWWPKTTNQVLDLDDGQNIAVAQQFKIGKHFKYIPKEVPFFEMSFDYAANDDEFLRNSKGELLWNGQVIAEFALEDRKVATFKQKMSFKPGENRFTFRAKTGSQFGISNFKVVRLGLKDSISTNGQFTAKNHHNIIPGWTGHSSLFASKDFNQNWEDATVARIASKQGESLTQTFHFNKDFRFRTNRYHLSLEMAPTEGAALNVPLAELSWNGKIFPLIATSRQVQKFKVEVIAVRGPNMISISGQGKEGEGLSVDNIQLTPIGSDVLAIKNGNFEDPEIKGKINSKVFYEIPEWEGNNIELGFGDTYNGHWTEGNDQVLSLATKQKTILYQVLVLTELATMGVEEPNVFTLSFKYAAEEGKPLAKTGGEVYWNKKLVGEFVPTSYQIIFYSQQITIDTGENHLLIKAAGGIEAYGLTIDDVKFVRHGSEDNLIENGDFNKPSTPGWTSVDNAPLLNHMWSSATVGRLDPNNNITLNRVFEFDAFYRFKTNKLHLLVDFAAKEGASLSTVGGTCHWNGVVEKLIPRDSQVQSVKIPVTANKGYNTVKFQGEGLTLDNVRLIPLGSVSNILFNGDFQIPVIDEHIQKMVPSGWSGYKELEFGNAYLLSREWGFDNGQIVSLTKRNKFLSQTVTLDSSLAIVRPEFPFFTLSLDYIPLDKDSQIIGQVFWNDHLVTTLHNKKSLNHLEVRLDAIQGENTLLINPKNQGLAFSNVKLIRFALNENIVKNGNFKAVKNGDEIPFWKGKATVDKSQEYLDQWEGQKVAVLDDKSGGLSQSFKFDGNLRYITQDFVVSFQYGVRQGVTFDAAKAKVFWNNDVFDFNLNDHNLHVFKRVLHGRKGNNNLIFESNGQKRTFGTFAEGFDIDNVCVRSFGSVKNLLKNHDFDQPKIVGFEFGMFTKKVPGWITNSIYIGVGHYFGVDWGWNQILELAGEKENAKIMQQIKVKQNWEIQL